MNHLIACAVCTLYHLLYLRCITFLIVIAAHAHAFEYWFIFQENYFRRYLLCIFISLQMVSNALYIPSSTALCLHCSGNMQGVCWIYDFRLKKGKLWKYVITKLVLKEKPLFWEGGGGLSKIQLLLGKATFKIACTNMLLY